MTSAGDGEAARAAAAIPALYERHAAAWVAARMDRGLETPWIERLAGELPPGASILDLGCGHGVPVAAALIARGFRVTGVDAAPSLIAQAAATLPDGRWLVGDMRTFSSAERFDAVVAWHSFFHLPAADQRAMFARFAALCAPGGLLLFTSGNEAGVEIGAWQGEPLFHASLSLADYAALLELNGFALIAHAEADRACGGATVWLARLEPGAGGQAR